MSGSGESIPTTLQPGQSIKPNVSVATAQKLVETHYGLKVESIKQLNSYDDNNFYVKGSSSEGKTEKFVFKVLNSMDSKKSGHIEAEHEVMLHLASKGLNCSTPVKNTNGQTFSLETIQSEATDVDNNKSKPTENAHIIRLLSFVEGKIMYDVTPTPKLLEKVGKYIAELETFVKGMSLPALENHTSVWFMSSVLELEKFTFVIKDQPERLSLVSKTLNAYRDQVLPLLPKLEKGIFHGDFNEQNIIVQPSATDAGEYDIHGLIDFGDLQIGPYVFELAITCCYMMLECVKEESKIDPFVGAQNVLKGYSSVRKMSDNELEVLRILIASRLCQSLVMGAYTYSLDPGNEYLLTTAKTGWTLLNVLNEKSDEEMIACWKAALSQ